MTYGFGGSNSPAGMNSPTGTSPSGGSTSANAGRYGGSSSNTASSSAASSGGRHVGGAGSSASNFSGGTTSSNTASSGGRHVGGAGSSASNFSGSGSRSGSPSGSTSGKSTGGGGGGSTASNAGRYGGPTGNVASTGGARATTPASTPTATDKPATGYTPDLHGRTRMGKVSFGVSDEPTTGIESLLSPDLVTPTSTFSTANPKQPSGFNVAINAAPTDPNAEIDSTRRGWRAAEDASVKGLDLDAAMKSLDEPKALDPRISWRATEDVSMAKEQAWQGLLTGIRGPEAGKNPYNKVSGGAIADLEHMTLAQVQNYQKTQMKGLPSTAVGAYQTIASTLDKAIKNLGLDPDKTMFSKPTQDLIARELISERAALATKKDGTLDPTDFANQLSKEWAAFKNSSGVGSYDQVGINKATVDFDTVHTLASNLLNSNAIRGPKGTSFAQSGKEITRPTTQETTAAEEPTTPQPAPSQPTTQANVSLPQRAPKPTSRDAPAYQRSLKGTALAGGIDLLGFNNPVGLGVEALSVLFGGDTTGGLVADAVGGKFGENYASPERNTPMRGLGSGGDRFATEQPASTIPKALQSPKSALETTASTFEDKYLGGSSSFDDTGRPTPEQKWDWTSSKYIGVANAPSV